MRIVIRAEIGEVYGLGHGARMRALAQVLCSRGAEVEFVTITPAFRDFVAPFGCSIVPAASAEDVCAAVLAIEPDVFVSDTTSAFPEELYALIRDGCGCPPSLSHAPAVKIVRIDHPNATPDTCDLLVGPCAHWSAATADRLHAEFGNRFLYGWDYVLLDDGVTNHAPVPYDEREADILFCAGGCDPAQHLCRMWKWTNDLVLPQARCWFCVGSHADMWNFGGETTPDLARLVVPFSRKRLRQAALVVTMFGQTVYECLYYQTPVIAFARTWADADAVERLAAWNHPVWHTSGVTAGGTLAGYDAAGFQEMILAMWDHADHRQAMSTACQGLLDGQGTVRVAEAILALGS